MFPALNFSFIYQGFLFLFSIRGNRLFRILLGIVILLFSGCSVYQSVTGYFNTYYNAKKVFDDAETEIIKQFQSIRDTNYFIQYKISTAIDDKLDKVIEKCSKLLQYYQESNLIDDALLMIGKAYLYKGESDAAILKFQELLDNFPTSDLKLQAKLLLAKAKYYNHASDDALIVISELKEEAAKEKENDILVESLMLKGQIYFEKEYYAQAAAIYSEAVEANGGKYLRAIAQYRAGELYELVGDYKNAADAYKNVTNLNPSPYLNFISRVSYGRMLSKLGKFEEALITFELLEEEDLKPEEIAQIELEIAKTYGDEGDSAKAFSVFTFIDTTYKKTDAAAKSYYYRGLIYEDKYLDFKNALEYFDKARNEFPASSITVLAQSRAECLKRYFQYYNDLAKYDSTLDALLNPDSSKVKDTLLSSGVKQSAFDTLSIEHDTLKIIPKNNQVISDTNEIKLHENLTELNELEEDSEPETSGKVQNSDNDELGITKVSPLPEGGASRIDTVPVNLPSNVLARLQGISDIAKLSPDSVKNLITQTQFELAGLFLVELNLPDSAKKWYEKIIIDNPNSPLIPRAIYTLAEIYRMKNDTTAVDSVYNILVNNYQDSEYSLHVKKFLGYNLDTIRVNPEIIIYEEAIEFIEQGDLPAALNKLLFFVNNYPQSKYTAQAIYTIGWVYENLIMNNDSAAYYYQKLSKDFAGTIYAEKVKPKIAVKEKPDSLPQYVKVKEIPLVQKRETVQSVKQSQRITDKKDKKVEDNFKKGRRVDQDVEEDEEIEEEEPEVPDKDDENP